MLNAKRSSSTSFNMILTASSSEKENSQRYAGAKFGMEEFAYEKFDIGSFIEYAHTV